MKSLNVSSGALGDRTQRLGLLEAGALLGVGRGHGQPRDTIERNLVVGATGVDGVKDTKEQAHGRPRRGF